MADIYDQHAAAFARVSAYAILKDGDVVARIAFKFPADGAGRLYAYVHWIGTEMARGCASGGGENTRRNPIELESRRSPMGLLHGRPPRRRRLMGSSPRKSRVHGPACRADSFTF